MFDAIRFESVHTPTAEKDKQQILYPGRILNIPQDRAPDDLLLTYRDEDYSQVNCIMKRGRYSVLRSYPHRGSDMNQFIIVQSNTLRDNQKAYNSSRDQFRYLIEMEKVFAQFSGARLGVCYNHVSDSQRGRAMVNIPIPGLEKQQFTTVMLEASEFIKKAIVGDISTLDIERFGIRPLTPEEQRLYSLKRQSLWLVATPVISGDDEGTMYIESIKFTLHCIATNHFHPFESYWEQNDLLEQAITSHPAPAWMMKFVDSFNSCLPRLMKEVPQFMKLSYVYHAYLYISMNIPSARYESNMTREQMYPIGSEAFSSLPMQGSPFFDVAVGVLFLHNGDHDFNLFKPTPFSRTAQCLLASTDNYDDNIYVRKSEVRIYMLNVVFPQLNSAINAKYPVSRSMVYAGADEPIDAIRLYYMNELPLNSVGVSDSANCASRSIFIELLNRFSNYDVMDIRSKTLSHDQDANLVKQVERLTLDQGHTGVHVAIAFEPNNTAIAIYARHQYDDDKFSHFNIDIISLEKVGGQVAGRDTMMGSYIAEWQEFLKNADVDVSNAMKRICVYYRAAAVDGASYGSSADRSSNSTSEYDNSNAGFKRPRGKEDANQDTDTSQPYKKLRAPDCFPANLMSTMVGEVILAADIWIKDLVVTHFSAFPGILRACKDNVWLLPTGFFEHDKNKVFNARCVSLQVHYYESNSSSTNILSSIMYGKQTKTTPKYIQDFLDVLNLELPKFIDNVPCLEKLRDVYIAYYCIATKPTDIQKAESANPSNTVKQTSIMSTSDTSTMHDSTSHDMMQDIVTTSGSPTIDGGICLGHNGDYETNYAAFDRRNIDFIYSAIRNYKTNPAKNSFIIPRPSYRLIQNAHHRIYPTPSYTMHNQPVNLLVSTTDTVEDVKKVIQFACNINYYNNLHPQFDRSKDVSTSASAFDVKSGSSQSIPTTESQSQDNTTQESEGTLAQQAAGIPKKTNSNDEAKIFLRLINRIPSQAYDNETVNDPSFVPLIMILSRVLIECIVLNPSSAATSTASSSSSTGPVSSSSVQSSFVWPGDITVRSDLSHDMMLMEVFSFMSMIHLEAEVDIMCNLLAFIYINRLQSHNSNFMLTPENYKAIWVTSFIIAQKTWMKKPKRSRDFSELFGVTISASQLRSWEQSMLEKVEFEVRIDAKLYAHYYQCLRVATKRILGVGCLRKWSEGIDIAGMGTDDGVQRNVKV